MKISALKNIFPSAGNALLAFVSAILLILAFPDFEFWFLAPVALIPFFWAIERGKEFWRKSFFAGWIFGTTFFFGTCWWLTFAPITYAKIPGVLAYFLMFCVASIVGIFPGIFAAVFSILLKRFDARAIFAAPFLWTATEFLRYWLTGNSWNAIGYSQAFLPDWFQMALPDNFQLASFGGIYLVGFVLIVLNSVWAYFLVKRKYLGLPIFAAGLGLIFFAGFTFKLLNQKTVLRIPPQTEALLVAVQPNVPMSGLTYEKYQQLLERHVELAEDALKTAKQNVQPEDEGAQTVIVFPESPMIFLYGRDTELQDFLRNFARRNNASVLFNSAELTDEGKQAFNSAVMIDNSGDKRAQYDKIHLLPFGEFIPFPEPLASQMPAFVGNFAFGKEYDLLNFGEAKGGVMICFESHFASLSREYVLNGADVLIEMTNDGYLGETPVLRQHLANAVFRAVETNRPVLRVTNVGITAYVSERGNVIDAADVYKEATRVWKISKSDGRQTIYVKYGDWFAWLCSIASLALLFFSFKKRKLQTDSQNLQ